MRIADAFDDIDDFEGIDDLDNLSSCNDNSAQINISDDVEINADEIYHHDDDDDWEVCITKKKMYSFDY